MGSRDRNDGCFKLVRAGAQFRGHIRTEHGLVMTIRNPVGCAAGNHCVGRIIQQIFDLFDVGLGIWFPVIRHIHIKGGLITNLDLSWAFQLRFRLGLAESCPSIGQIGKSGLFFRTIVFSVVKTLSK